MVTAGGSSVNAWGMNAVCRGASDELGDCKSAALRCMLYSVTSWLDEGWKWLDGQGVVTVIEQCLYRTMASLTLYVRSIIDM